MYKIEVLGEIHNPGTYYFKPGERIFDAIEVAGGATDDADLDNINLAQKLKRGDKIVVPTVPVD